MDQGNRLDALHIDDAIKAFNKILEQPTVKIKFLMLVLMTKFLSKILQKSNFNIK